MNWKYLCAGVQGRDHTAANFRWLFGPYDLNVPLQIRRPHLISVQDYLQPSKCRPLGMMTRKLLSANLQEKILGSKTANG